MTLTTETQRHRGILVLLSDVPQLIVLFISVPLCLCGEVVSALPKNTKEQRELLGLVYFPDSLYIFPGTSIDIDLVFALIFFSVSGQISFMP